MNAWRAYCSNNSANSDGHRPVTPKFYENLTKILQAHHTCDDQPNATGSRLSSLSFSGHTAPLVALLLFSPLNHQLIAEGPWCSDKFVSIRLLKASDSKGFSLFVGRSWCSFLLLKTFLPFATFILIKTFLLFQTFLLFEAFLLSPDARTTDLSAVLWLTNELFVGVCVNWRI